jgi:hypothetical protein
MLRGSAKRQPSAVLVTEYAPGAAIGWHKDRSVFFDSLDGVAASIEDGRETILPVSVRLGRDVRHRTHSLDLSADGIAVITVIAVQDRGTWHLFEQNRSSGAIGYLTPVSKNATGRHSVSAWIFVVRPPRDRPMAC